MGVNTLPRSMRATGLGPHDSIREIVVLVGLCGHIWRALVGQDERQVLLYVL